MAHTYKVLIADQLSEDGIKLLKAEPQLSVDVRTGLSPQQLAEIIEPYDGLVVRSATKVTAEVIARAKHLKVIGRAGVGLDNVDAEAATKRGIIVMNVPAGNTMSTAEHTLSMIMAVARRIPQADAHARAGKWERSKFVGVELFGKTLGIVGLGKIGAEVAKRAQAFGMRLLAHDPFLSSERAQQLGIETTTLQRIYAEADFITVHTPLTAETKHMIGAKEMAQMKPTVRLINCARGGIIDEQALAAAVSEGRIAGAAVDVFEEEPPKDHPFLKLDKIVVTPHLGASTAEAQLNVAIEIAQQVADALLGRGIRNASNMPSIDGATYKVLQPYIALGEKLGAIAAQLSGGQVAEVRVTYVGEVTAHDTSAVTLAILKGILAPSLGEGVNYVNASLIAAERGIKVVEAKANRLEEFANLLSVEVRCNGTALTVQGTLSSRREPRIVKIDEYFVEAAPQGYMLIIKNEDKPGLIGQLGTLLGQANINIAGMTNGREQPGGMAITIVNIDSAVPPSVLEQVKQLRHVMDAKLITL
jgi:D-3-phosphoglycerate dehydrogenase